LLRVAGGLAVLAYAAPGILSTGPLLPTKKNAKNGLFQVRLGLLGQDTIVSIDEKVPCAADGTILFMPVPRRLCVAAVVAKAMAKRRGKTYVLVCTLEG
jgi:hypothetical protein